MRPLLSACLLSAAIFAACSGDSSAPPTGAAGSPDDDSQEWDPTQEVEQDPPEEETAGAGGAGGEASGEGGSAGGESTAGTGGTGGSSSTNACASGIKTQTTKGEDMNAGRACLNCHKGKPDLVVAGTVFGAPGQPNSCAAVEPDGDPVSGATMTIIDGEGTEVAVEVRPRGNFLIPRKDHALVPPFLARLTWEGRTVEKQVAVPTGDCNGCHTQQGTKGASGRIVLP